jgi:titin
VRVDFDGKGIGASPKAGPFQDLGAGAKSYTFWDDATMPALPSLPAAPSNFTVTAASSSENKLAWTNNASNATHMVVERRKEGGDWVIWGYVNTTQDTITDDKLDQASRYQYRIAARNAAGLSAFVSPR